MSNDNKTLADVQPGGRVRLGDGLPPLPKPGYVTGGDYGHEAHNAYTPEQLQDYARAALSAHPSPGGQDALAEAARRVIRDIDSGDYHGEISEATYAALEAALAARQPVGKLTDAEIDARLNTLYRDLVASGKHNGGMSGVAWDRAVYRMASNSPAQAVDLGELRKMLDGWKNSDYPFSYEGQCAQRALDACVADLKGWLYSQAVGNG